MSMRAFQVVAEDFVEANLEAGNAGLLADSLLVLRNPLFATGGKRAERIKFFVIAFFDEIAVSEFRGARINNRCFEGRSKVSTQVQFAFESIQDGTCSPGEFCFD